MSAADRWLAPALAGGLIAGFYLLLAFHAEIAGFAPVDGRLFVGPDSWMRAYRALELWAHGHWFSDSLLRVGDPPVAQHWSRPVDALNLLAGLLLSPLGGGIKGGLELWATVAGPLQAVVLCFLLAWAVRPVARGRTMLLFVLVVPAQIAIWGYFFPGRIDWHPPTLMTVALAVGLATHLLGGFAPRRVPVIRLGVAVGVLMWAGPEGFVAVTAAIAAVGVLWAWDGRTELASAMRRFARALAWTVTGAVLLEQGPSLHVIAYDEISLFHALLFWAHALFWTVAARWLPAGAGGRGILVRLAAGLLATAAVGAFVALCYPNLLEGRLNTWVDRTYIQLRAVHILENQKLFSLAALREEGLDAWVSSLPDLWAFWLAAASLPLLVAFDAARRAAWIALGLMLVIVLGGNLEIRVRHAPALLLIALPVVLVALADALSWIGRRLLRPGPVCGVPSRIRGVPGGPSRRGPRLRRLSALAAGLMIALLAIGLAVGPGAPEAPANSASAHADAPLDSWRLLRAATPVLRQLPAGTVGTFADLGPEILYRTPHRVLSIPTHRDQPGFRGLHAALAAEDPAVARQNLIALGVDYLLLIEAGSAARFQGLATDQTGSFGRRVVDGQAPDWLNPVAGTPDLPGLHLYRVAP